jgi:hypothetical protein
LPFFLFIPPALKAMVSYFYCPYNDNEDIVSFVSNETVLDSLAPPDLVQLRLNFRNVASSAHSIIYLHHPTKSILNAA